MRNFKSAKFEHTKCIICDSDAPDLIKVGTATASQPSELYMCANQSDKKLGGWMGCNCLIIKELHAAEASIPYQAERRINASAPLKSFREKNCSNQKISLPETCFSEKISACTITTALFIPIKLNNQRLPGKNTMLLNGKPLCEYIFNTVKNIAGIDEKYVYCSDEAITSYMPEGVKFLKRDARLDSWETKGLEIIEAFVSDVDADVYILTHATAPFTKAASIAQALGKVVSGKYDSAFSAVALKDYCWYHGKPLNYDMQDVVRTQDVEPIFVETSAFFIFTKAVFQTLHQRIGKNPYMYIVDSLEAIDIDDATDFAFAEVAAEYIAKGKRISKLQ
jgi:CMP-N-acetylneuraminic acid synthetase